MVVQLNDSCLEEANHRHRRHPVSSLARSLEELRHPHHLPAHQQQGYLVRHHRHRHLRVGGVVVVVVVDTITITQNLMGMGATTRRDFARGTHKT
jgi:hypothetical protein